MSKSPFDLEMPLRHSAIYGSARTSGHIFEMGRKFCYKIHIWGALKWSQTLKKSKKNSYLKKFGSQPKRFIRHSAKYIFTYIRDEFLFGGTLVQGGLTPKKSAFLGHNTPNFRRQRRRKF